MAGDKQDKQANQQATALHLAGQQHKGQRHQGDNPGVDRQHNPNLRRFHAKAVGDIRQQAHGRKFGGIKDKCRNRKRDYAQPRDLA